MIDEEYYSIDLELPNTDFYSNYRANGVKIDYSTMEELAECFAGFATMPVGVFKHKAFEVASYEFKDIDEVKDFIIDKYENGAEMILYYIAPVHAGVQVRMARV